MILSVLNTFIKHIESKEWPLVNMRAKEAERAAQMFAKKNQPDNIDNEVFFDAQEF